MKVNSELAEGDQAEQAHIEVLCLGRVLQELGELTGYHVKAVGYKLKAWGQLLSRNTDEVSLGRDTKEILLAMKDMLLSLLNFLVNFLQIYSADHLNKFYIEDEAAKINSQFVGIQN